MSIAIAFEVLLAGIVLLALVPVLAAVVYRLGVVRRSSIPVLMSMAPGEQFRHGSIRFSGEFAGYYRLVSVRFGPDLRIQRRSITLGSRRAPTGPELDVAEYGEVVIPLRGRERSGSLVEAMLCLDPQALTALQSWVEACSTEQVRRKGAK